MKVASVVSLFLAASVLAGCHPALTLEEAQAACTAQGGLLVVIYTEKITRSRVGPVVAAPGNCVSPSQFDKNAAPGAPPAAASNVPPAQPAD